VLDPEAPQAPGPRGVRPRMAVVAPNAVSMAEPVPARVVASVRMVPVAHHVVVPLRVLPRLRPGSAGLEHEHADGDGETAHKHAYGQGDCARRPAKDLGHRASEARPTWVPTDPNGAISPRRALGFVNGWQRDDRAGDPHRGSPNLPWRCGRLPGLGCEVASGSVTGLLGPSGSGKSTLIRAIVGVQKVAGGAVGVLGHPAGSPALRARVGYMTQAPSVYGDLTVRENLGFFARVLAQPHDAVDRVLVEVALQTHAGRIVSRLSGGERVRVSLATALLGSPELLVLDEPTVGLDPVLRRDLWELFHELAERGTTLLVSSHVMDEADRCDALLLLREGRLLAQADELRARTGEPDLDAAFLHLVEEAL
jgi:ABC-2 type transport system ATP-binding protein